MGQGRGQDAGKKGGGEGPSGAMPAPFIGISSCCLCKRFFFTIKSTVLTKIIILPLMFMVCQFSMHLWLNISH